MISQETNWELIYDLLQFHGKSFLRHDDDDVSLFFSYQTFLKEDYMRISIVFFTYDRISPKVRKL